MIFKLACLRKALSTLLAREGFLSSVDSQVLLQVCFLYEILPALNAPERSLSGVDAYVILQVSFLGETLPTLKTDERVGSCSASCFLIMILMHFS